MSKSKPRFDLFATLEWTAAIAFLCALCAGAGSSAVWTWQFKTLPPDDSNLRAWLEKHDRHEVVVSREGTSVTLTTQTGLIAGLLQPLNLPQPPWQELGYLSLHRMHGSAKWTMFSGSPYLWLSGFGVLIGLAIIRRRYIKPIHSST